MDTHNVEPAVTQSVALKLTDEMSHWMANAGVIDTESWKVGLHKEAVNAVDRNVERFWLNRHWRQLLTKGLSMEDTLKTREARGCLMDGDCPLPEYIRKFQTVVIPCAIQMGILKTA